MYYAVIENIFSNAWVESTVGFETYERAMNAALVMAKIRNRTYQDNAWEPKVRRVMSA